MLSIPPDKSSFRVSAHYSYSYTPVYFKFEFLYYSTYWCSMDKWRDRTSQQHGMQEETGGGEGRVVLGGEREEQGNQEEEGVGEWWGVRTGFGGSHCDMKINAIPHAIPALTWISTVCDAVSSLP